MSTVIEPCVNSVNPPVVELEPWGVIWPAPTILLMRQWLINVLVTGTVVIVSPHADDAEIAAGALIRWLVDHGFRVVVILLYPGHRCSGELGVLTAEEATARRLDENRNACRITGAELLYLGLTAAYDRSGYQPDRAEVWKLSRVIRRLHPDVILVPPRHDPHGAHQAARATVARALCLAECESARIVTYDGAWGGLGGENAANLAFPFDEALETTKRSANLAFETQLEPTNVADLAQTKDQLAALRLPELLAGHHSVGNSSFDGMVGCEMFRHEILDPLRAKGPWADPIHVALLAMAEHSPDWIDKIGQGRVSAPR
jgi:LmbE family N-acetylglucosaminyl deacetylase